jgi:hypothetical protein
MERGTRAVAVQSTTVGNQLQKEMNLLFFEHFCHRLFSGSIP